MLTGAATVRQDYGSLWSRTWPQPNGAACLRENLEQSGVLELLTPKLSDPRRQGRRP